MTFTCTLPHLGQIRVSGADADTFLQSQLSNDLSKLAAGRLQLSSYSNAKGRVLAVLGLRRAEDAILLETRRELVQGLLKRLRMYVLRSKVVLEDASGETAALGLWGSESAATLAGAGLPTPDQDWDSAEASGVVVMRHPGTQPRYSLHGTVAAIAEVRESLAARTRVADTDAWRLQDILAGLPAVGLATAEHFVPQMLDLDRVGAISFSKGCYPGQEIVARMHYLGKLKRRLFLAYAGADVAPATDVFAEGEAQAVGEVVESAPDPEHGNALLLVLQTSRAGSANLHLGSPQGETLTAPLGFVTS